MASCGPPSDFGDRLGNVRISATAADVAAHALPELGVAELHRHVQVARDVARDSGFDFFKYRYRGANLAWCAIAALIAIVLDESCLHWMQPLWSAEPLDCGDLVALMHDRERQAGIDPPAINDDRACAA